jgi:hypothetical protein
LATTFTAFSCLRFRLEINSFSQNSYFPVGSKQRATTTLDFEDVFLVFSLFACTVYPACSYIFVCVTFQPIDFCYVPNLPHFRLFVHSFALQWLPNFTLREMSALQTFGLYQLFPTLKTAATSQVKLCPYDEEEPHIWFRLIEAQFAVAGIKSQKPTPLPACPSKSFRTFLSLLAPATTQMSCSIF